MTGLFCLLVFIEDRRKSEAPLGSHDPRTAVQLRTALKRLKEIMEGKSQVLISSELAVSVFLRLLKMNVIEKKHPIFEYFLHVYTDDVSLDIRAYLYSPEYTTEYKSGL